MQSWLFRQRTTTTPLLGALGAADPDTDTFEVWNEYRELGSMSMTSYLFHA